MSVNGFSDTTNFGTIASYELLCRFAALKGWRLKLGSKPHMLRRIAGLGSKPVAEGSRLTALEVYKSRYATAPIASAPLNGSSTLDEAAAACIEQLERIGEPWRENDEAAQ